jgi:hypothetical protein
VAFELYDIIRLPNVRLIRAGLIPKEERADDQKDQQLKIQMFFCSPRCQKGSDKIMANDQILRLHALIGEPALVKFKLPEDVFRRCMELGLEDGGLSDWEAIPQPWFFVNKSNGNKTSGVWYRPATLLRAGGKDINYHILKPAQKPQLQDAFAYFGKSSNTHSNLDASLGDLEHQINSELEHA